MTYTITPIGTARSPYKQKFGIARQPPPPQPSRTLAPETRTHRNRQTRPPLLQRRRPAGRHTDCGHQTLYPLCRIQTRCRIRFRQRQTRRVGSRLAGKHRRGKFICKHQKPYQPKHCPRSAPRLSEYSRTDLCDEYCRLRSQISNRGKPCNRY